MSSPDLPKPQDLPPSGEVATGKSSKRAKPRGISKTLLYIGKAVLILAVVGLACWKLSSQLKDVKLEEVANGFHEIRAWKIGLAVFFTGLYYLVLTGYDLIALRYMNKSIGLFKVMIGAIVGYAVSHQFGWIFGGTAARYYLYSNWGLRGWEIVKFIAILSLTYWLGLFVTAGVSFTLTPLKVSDEIDSYLPAWLQLRTTFPVGVSFLVVGAAYLIATVIWHKPIKWGGVEIDLPSFRISLLQLVVSGLDFVLAAAVFYVLLPKSNTTSFAHVVGGYLLAQILIATLHVPGGWGVFETVMLSTLNAHSPEERAHVISVIVVYRVVYTALPLIAGLALIGWNEVSKWQQAAQAIAELDDDTTAGRPPPDDSSGIS